MTISKIDVWNFRPPFRDGPYAMSHVTSGHVYGRILRIEDDDGSSGVGETVFSPALTETDREQRVQDEIDYLRPLIGKPFAALLDVASELRNRGKSWRGIAFALETAWFDPKGNESANRQASCSGAHARRTYPTIFRYPKKRLPAYAHAWMSPAPSTGPCS